MSRNIAKFVTQMSHDSKYSSESLFSNVTAPIVNVKALHSAVSSECSCNQFWMSWSHFPLSHQPILNLKFVVISDVFWCSSIHSQPSLLHLFLVLFASTFLARSHHITDSSWRSLKSILSLQTTSFFFWCSWKIFRSFSKFFNHSTLSYSDISSIHWSYDVIVSWDHEVSSTFCFSSYISHSTSSVSSFTWSFSTKRKTEQKLFQSSTWCRFSLIFIWAS